MCLYYIKYYSNKLIDNLSKSASSTSKISITRAQLVLETIQFGILPTSIHIRKVQMLAETACRNISIVLQQALFFFIFWTNPLEQRGQELPSISLFTYNFLNVFTTFSAELLIFFQKYLQSDIILKGATLPFLLDDAV